MAAELLLCSIGLLYAAAAAQYIPTDCSQLASCTSCASKPECGWFPECNSCVLGGPSGAHNASVCPSARCSSFIFHPAMCPVACTKAVSATQCVERPGCVYCSRVPGDPASTTDSVPSPAAAYPIGYAIKYEKVKLVSGSCAPVMAGTSGSSAVPDLRAAYDASVLAGDIAAASLSFSTYASYYTCSSTTIGSAPDAGQATGRQSALAAVQAQLCGPITSPGNCTLQSGCGWCTTTAMCIAYAVRQDNFTFDISDPLLCPGSASGNSSLASLTASSSYFVQTGRPERLDAFCGPLAVKGCRVCAAAGCQYCHSTNVCHNSSAPAAVCPRLGLSGSSATAVMVSSGDAGKCDDFCENANSQSFRCSVCLASKHCNYCRPPADTSFGFPYNFDPSSLTGGYCKAVNGTLATDPFARGSTNVCGWKAHSGLLTTELTAKSGYPKVIVPQLPILGGTGNVSVCPAHFCSSLSPAACVFSIYCSLCSATGLPLRCMEKASANAGACVSAQGVGGQVVNGRGSDMTQYNFYTNLKQIYPNFCSDLGAGVVGPPASACIMSAGLCGWCVDRQQCVFNSNLQSGTPLSGCNATALNYAGSTLSTTSLTASTLSLLPAASSCQAVTDETVCLASPACGWCSGHSGAPGYPRCMLGGPFGRVGFCAAGWSSGGNVPGSRPASCMELQGCGACLSAGRPGSNYSVVDGPCGYCAATGACLPGSASGGPASSYPAVLPDVLKRPYDYPLMCPGTDVGWRFGGVDSAAYAQCAVPIDSFCSRFTSCEACAARNSDTTGAYSSGCQWCLGTNKCINSTMTCSTGEAVRYLSLDPFKIFNFQLVPSIAKCPSFCRALSPPPVGSGSCNTCLAYKDCGMCTSTNTCVSGNLLGPVGADVAACPLAKTWSVPAGAPAGSAPVPGWLYGFTDSPDYYGDAPSPSNAPSPLTGWCPNRCAALTSCSACIAAPGCGWARNNTALAPNGGRCIPGNATFGPFRAGSVAPDDWFPDSCAGPCGVGSNAATKCTARWGCGYCAVSNSQICLPANPLNLAAGPIAGSCRAPWFAGPGSDGSMFNGGGTLTAAANTTAGSFDSAVSACDRSCLLGGFSLVYKSSDPADASTGVVTLTPFRRAISSIANCRCVAASISIALRSQYSADTINALYAQWGMNGNYANRVVPLSTLPSSSSVTFSLSPVSSVLFAQGVGSFALATQSGSATRTAYFWLRGCSATLASPVCYGAATFTAAASAQTVSSYFDQCAAACARESFALVYVPADSFTPFSPEQGLTVRVPLAPQLTIGGVPCVCNETAGRSHSCTALAGSSRSTVSVLLRPASSSDAQAAGTSIGFGAGKTVGSNGSVPRDYITRFASFPGLAEGGYAMSALTSCTGSTPFCSRTVDVAALAAAGLQAAPSVTPTASPAAAAAVTAAASPSPASIGFSYGAAVRAGSANVSDRVDDCTYACLLGGFTITLDAAAAGTVQFMPAAAAPLPGCTCRTMSGSTSGRTASGTIISSSTGASYTFSAVVAASERISLSIAAASDGAPLGIASYDAAGCTNGTATFCGRMFVAPSAYVTDAGSDSPTGGVTGGGSGGGSIGGSTGGSTSGSGAGGSTGGSGSGGSTGSSGTGGETPGSGTASGGDSGGASVAAIVGGIVGGIAVVGGGVALFIFIIQPALAAKAAAAAATAAPSAAAAGAASTAATQTVAKASTLAVEVDAEAPIVEHTNPLRAGM